MKFFQRVKEGCVMPAWGIGWTDSHQESYIFGKYYVLYITLGMGRRMRLSWQFIWNKEKV